jgi:hypothetical protein
MENTSLNVSRMKYVVLSSNHKRSKRPADLRVRYEQSQYHENELKMPLKLAELDPRGLAYPSP